MQNLVVLLVIIASAALSACASGSETRPDDSGGEQEKVAAASGAEQEKAATASTKTPGEESASPDPLAALDRGVKAAEIAWTPDGGAQTPTAIAWLGDGRLALGFEGAKVGFSTLDKAGNIPLQSSYAAPRRVMTISPDGLMAMLQAPQGDDPPVLVRISDGAEVLRMNDLAGLSALDAAFSQDARVFLVSLADGRLMIWNNADELHTLPDERIEQFLNRQAPDFVANFGSLTGPLALVGPPYLVGIADKNGQLTRWDPQSPTKIRPIAKIAGSPAALALTPSHIAATDAEGEFRLAELESRTLLKWSRGVGATAVAADPALGERVVIFRNGSLSSRNAKSGLPIWKTQPLQGEYCGISLDPANNRLALCLDAEVGVFDISSGELLNVVEVSQSGALAVRVVAPAQ